MQCQCQIVEMRNHIGKRMRTRAGNLIEDYIEHCPACITGFKVLELLQDLTDSGCIIDSQFIQLMLRLLANLKEDTDGK